MIYFGVNLKKSKFGFSLTRENYIHHSKKSSFKNIEYDDKYTSTQTRRALFNFDLNMKFFSCLDSNEFNHTLQKFLKFYIIIYILIFKHMLLLISLILLFYFVLRSLFDLICTIYFYQ